MKKKHGAFLVIIALAMMGVSLAAQEEGTGAKTNLTLDFNATAVSVNSDGDVDSFTDSGFGDDNESTLSFSYESDLFGGTASLGFGPQSTRFFDDDLGSRVDYAFAIDELYAWIKPFGQHFKFTAGIFENTDGVADYTDDIDNFGMGAFVNVGEAPVTDPTVNTGIALVNGFMPELTFGPVTAQVLFSPNFSISGANEYFNGFFDAIGYGGSVFSDAEARAFRIGGRIIADIGPATISALFKSSQWTMDIYNIMAGVKGTPNEFPGTGVNNMTFGVYADITAVENLGVSLGYTGFITASDDGDIENILWNGIDIRAAWNGIEGISLSTHNNISFAKGSDKDWSGFLPSDDSSFFSLYNAIGTTITLTEKFSVNGEIGNVFSKTEYDNATMPNIDYDTLWGQVKLITAVTENAEFTAGVRVDFTTQTGVDDSTVFSVPLGIKVSF